MARAVIKLSGDLSPAMPLISRLVTGCAYNPEVHLAAFNLKGMPVIITADEMTIYGAEDEAAARNIMDWLKKILDTENEMKNEVN